MLVPLVPNQGPLIYLTLFTTMPSRITSGVTVFLQELQVLDDVLDRRTHDGVPGSNPFRCRVNQHELSGHDFVVLETFLF